MKNVIKILLMVMTIALMNGCSAQKRAERHIRRAVELCPDLVQMTAHPIDTFLGVPGYTDIARVPMSEVLGPDIFSVETEHGTFTIGLNENDSTFEIGFTADPTEIHYQDTVQHPQVILPEPEARKERSFKWLALLLFGVIVGMVLYVYLSYAYLEKPENKETK